MTTKKYNELVKKVQKINSKMTPEVDIKNRGILFGLIDIKKDYITNFNEFSNQEKSNLYKLINTITTKHNEEMKCVRLAEFYP